MAARIAAQYCNSPYTHTQKIKLIANHKQSHGADAGTGGYGGAGAESGASRIFTL